jgi:hypothetical protein
MGMIIKSYIQKYCKIWLIQSMVEIAICLLAMYGKFSITNLKAKEMKGTEYKKLNDLDINQKINLRDRAYLFLEWNQYEQLINLNKLVLVPYYYDLMRVQAKRVQDAENFKSIYGKWQYEYENNI